LAPGAVIVARGRCDGSDTLAVADEALAALQRACGGSVPGPLAIPALLELTRKAWHFRMKLARLFQAQDGENTVSAWVEIAPDDDGLTLALSNWRVTPLAAAAAIETSGGDAVEAALLAQIADLYARLDARQGVLAVGSSTAALESVAVQMRSGFGRSWTDFVTIPGIEHRQPLHWRLIEGAEVAVDGLDGRWQARLLPLQLPGDGAAGGFELYLVPATIASVPEDAAAANAALPEALDGVLGRDLAPALRQPITRIIANAETIRTRLAGPLAEEYANYAADIAEAARHLMGLVEDLADLDAIEAPDFAPVPDAIDLADAARRAAGILGVRASERSISVELPGEDERLAATGEWRRVLQVLLNLLGNALRYSPEGSTVRVSVSSSPGRAAVTVADEGPGLTAGEQSRVFDKFERLGRSGDGGSGLGLYISRRLARAMGGDLTVASAPGEGARFTLELPPG
jgi:signal transduction histidine kinase